MENVWPQDNEEADRAGSASTDILPIATVPGNEPPSKSSDQQDITRVQRPVKPPLVYACDALNGHWYVGWQGNYALQLTGEQRLVFDVLEYRYHSEDRYGTAITDWIRANHPLVDDPVMAAQIREEHQQSLACQEFRNRPRQWYREKADGEVVRTNRPRSTAGGGVNPVTGYRAGTDSDLVAQIILRIGGGVIMKETCVDAIFQEILQDRGKTRSYAKAWYNQVTTQHPELLQVAAPPTTEVPADGHPGL